MRSGERVGLVLLLALTTGIPAMGGPLPPLPEALVTRSGKPGDGGGLRRLNCVRRGEPPLVFCRATLESAQGVEIASAPVELKLAKAWLAESLRGLARVPRAPAAQDPASAKAGSSRVTWSLRFDPHPAHQGQADLPELAPEPLLQLESKLLGRIDDELGRSKGAAH